MKKLLNAALLLILFSCQEHSTVIVPTIAEKNENTPAKPRSRVQPVDDGDIYNVINYCLANKEFFSPTCKNLIDSEAIPGGRLDEMDSLQLIKMDSIFTKEDVAYMSRQKNWEFYFKIKPDCVDNKYNLVSGTVFRHQNLPDTSKDFWERFYKNYPGGLNQISLPLFSKNRQYAVIHAGHYCGVLCGHWATYVMQKTPKGWKIKYKFNETVS